MNLFNYVRKIIWAIVALSLIAGCDKEQPNSLPTADSNQANIKQNTDKRTQNQAPQTVAKSLKDYLASLDATLPKDLPYRIAIASQLDELESKQAALTDKLSLSLRPFTLTSPTACADNLKPKLDQWLNHYQQQAEFIAAKSKACGDSCPQYNCGEYVDFLGMNSETLELITLLEDRMVDRALTSLDIAAFKPSSSEEFKNKLTSTFDHAEKQLKGMSIRILGNKDSLYQQRLKDLSLTLKDLSQTTISMRWSFGNDTGSLTLADTLSNLSQRADQLAYLYHELFEVADGGKATAATQEKIGLSVIGQLAYYFNLNHQISNSATMPTATEELTQSELACYESLSVNLGVTRELYTIASETVNTCSLKQSCKTQASPLYDAITQEQHSTDVFINKLENIHGQIDKVVLSYTNATCP
jgi:hypothetical protein